VCEVLDLGVWDDDGTGAGSDLRVGEAASGAVGLCWIDDGTSL
jgi:hypothetical protein